MNVAIIGAGPAGMTAAYQSDIGILPLLQCGRMLRDL
jgi:thioredoxin reductase